MNFIFFRLWARFRSLRRDFRQIGNQENFFSQRRDLLEEICARRSLLEVADFASLLSVNRNCCNVVSVLDASAGLLARPKVQDQGTAADSKEEGPLLRRVREFFWRNYFSILLHVKWKVTGWQASTLTAPVFIQGISIYFKVDDFCFENLNGRWNSLQLRSNSPQG